MAKKDKNKVKFGIKNVHLHPIKSIDTTKTDGSAYEYDTAFKLPGTQSLNLPSQWASEPVYADDIEYVTLTANQGYDGTHQVVQVTEEFEEKICGDVNGLENADTKTTEYGMSFEFDGDVNKGRVFLYHVALTKRPDIVHNTKTNSLTVDSDTLNIKVKPRLDTADIKLKVYPGDELYDSILTTPPNPVERRSGTQSGG